MKVSTCQERLNELFNSDSRNDTAIADELGVSKQTVSAWRNGSRSPKKPMLIKLAVMYHVSIEWLMGFDDDAPEKRETQDPQIQIVSGMMEDMSEDQKEQIVAIVRAIVLQQKKKG